MDGDLFQNPPLAIHRTSAMKLFRALVLCFLCIHISAHTAVHYIGLGRDCQIVARLKDFKLRSAAYPFDWMISHNFSGVIQAIEDDFAHFLDPAFLVYRTAHIENTYYNFLYNHFFPVVGQQPIDEDYFGKVIVPNYLDYLPVVQDTLNRRIQRLQALLMSNEKIIFIRTHALPQEAADFMNMIKTKYPQSNVTLVVVHERADLIGNWNIPNVINFYACQRSGFHNWWINDEWMLIFFKIQHWLTTGQLL